MIRSLLNAALGLAFAAVICGFGVLCVAGVRAAVRYHNRVDQPLLTHVTCRWHDGRLTMTGIVVNPNDGHHRVFVVPHYRLDDGVLPAGVTLRLGDVVAGHTSTSWRYVGSPMRQQPIRACAPQAFIDDED